jgi:hypothetical protein
MPLLPLLAIGGALAKGYFEGRGRKKRGESERQEQEELFGARKAAHEGGQARRGARLNAIQGLLERTGLRLPEGAPDYTFDPDVLAEMQKALPFGETIGSQQVGADPRAGAGSDLAAGFFGGLGGAADTAMLGAPGAGVSPGQPTGVAPVAFDPGQIDTQLDPNLLFRGR